MPSPTSGSKARLILTALVIENRPVAEVARDYGVSRSWLYELLARHKSEGEAAFLPRSRRPNSSPTATPAATIELILAIRKQLTEAGHDAGADTLRWHLEHEHHIVVSRATVHRVLARHGQVTPEPKKRPSPPTSGSPPRCRTRPGSPTSPTTGSPNPTAPPASTSK